MQDLSLRWWNLMEQSLKVGLCLQITKHIDSRHFVVTLAKLRSIDNPRKGVLLSGFDLHESPELFYKFERFVEKYKRDLK